LRIVFIEAKLGFLEKKAFINKYSHSYG